MSETLKVGLAQIAPVWLDRKKTTAKICDYVLQAADAACSLVAFGETLLPGYPFWLSSTHGSKFECDIQKDLHAHYLGAAVDLQRGDLQPICEIAKSRGIAVMLGCYELGSDRGGHTGYCSLIFIEANGEVRNAHRKLVPTYEERLAWGSGDGNGLEVFPIGPFTLGGLNCWENWMPLPRTALHGMGENLHVAVWPGAKRNTIDITRFIAIESRSYVLSVSGLLRKSDVPDDFPHRDLVLDSFENEIISDGGSCIAAPNGDWIVEPVCDREDLLIAELDYREVLRERQNFDISGHYSRPDVLKLSVNRDRQNCLEDQP
ncbi:carbon-nitrogen hydrolase family protein [Mariniblastus fucicola]|uniref:Aliphatic nitrilase n=1 Tax=Mariniblastus fucicola TaxID=980251 RepID=A0A5B9P7M5_9BACT|nr:carbon-nitrogen hydrolase family protein [Mariniblastus fucicola]QEG20950.1 Aliphatic nitrilase [Mariniblastus fucicola]